jgi:hypothetical protein
VFRSLIPKPSDKILIAALLRTIERRDLVPADPIHVCAFPGQILGGLQLAAPAGVSECCGDLVARWLGPLFEVGGQTIQQAEAR